MLYKYLVIFIATLTLQLFTACSTDKLVIETTPSNAEIRCDGNLIGLSTTSTEISFQEDGDFWKPREITASLNGYETLAYSLSRQDYLKKYKNTPLRLNLELLQTEIKCKITSTPSQAEVYLDGNFIGETPLSVPIKLNRENSKSAWTSPNKISLQKTNYQTANWNIAPNELDYRLNNTKNFNLELLKKNVIYSFDSIPQGATVKCDGKIIGTTPCKTTLLFARNNSNSPWNVTKISFEKDSFFDEEVFISGKDVQNDENCSVNLKAREISKKIILNCNVNNAEIWVNGRKTDLLTPSEYNVRLYRKSPNEKWSDIIFAVGAPRYQYSDTEDFDVKKIDVNVLQNLDTLFFKLEKKLWKELNLTVFQYGQRRFLKEKVRSYLWDIEKEPQVKSVTKVTNYAPKDMFPSRIATYNDASGEPYIIYSLPEIDGQNLAKSFNLWAKKVRGIATMRLTEGNFYDTCPTLTNDEQKVIFTSNRLGIDYIWRFNITGRGGYTKITGSNAADSWPVAIGTEKICYTSTLPSSSIPQIWSCNFDGTLPTQLREGQDPAISPDGKKIAYIAPDPVTNAKKLWIMDIDGGNPTQITTNPISNEMSPSWLPNGKQIVYASNQGVVDGVPNNDIWIINIDGVGQTQLTVNGSDDRYPVVDKTGKYVYFYSNRGMLHDNCSEIWRLELNTPQENK